MKLTLDHIQVTDLHDTGSYLDKQDPKVIINIGKVFLTTERKKDAGVAANFDDVLTADISEESYNGGVVFDIEVVNEGSFGGSKHVGRGTSPLKSLITDKNQHVSFVIPLTHFEKNGKGTTGPQKGQAIVRGYLEAPKPTPVQPISVAAAPAPAPVPAAAPVVDPELAPAATKPAAPTVAVVSTPAPPTASEPVNSKPAPAAAQAPTAAPAAAAKAEHVAPAQGKRPDPSTQAPQPEYDDSKPLKLRLSQLAVRDLKDKGGAMDKQDPALRITVGDNKAFDTNRVKDAGTSADFPEVFELDIPVAQFTNNLPIEVEAFNVGGAPFHSRTSLGKARIPLNSLVNTFNAEVPVVVDLMYPGKSGDVKQGQVLMCGYIGRALKGAGSGAEPVKGSATPAPAAPTAPAVASATGPAVTHHLFISSIKASKMKNVELMMGDKNDPYVLLGFGSNKWSFKSDHQEGAGSDALWTYVKGTPLGQKVHFPVTAEELQSAAFAVSVMDKNSFNADKLIGKGETHLAKVLVWTSGANSEVKSGEVAVALHDASGAASGTVVLTVERETLVEGSPLPKPVTSATVTEGTVVPAAAATPTTPTTSQVEATEAELSLYKHTLYISKVAGKDLRNVEKMMFDKNDPYMILKFGENTWSYTTVFLAEKGSDPVWEYDFRRDPQMKFTVALQELRSAAGLLKVVAMDKNSALSDALIGEGDVAVLSADVLNPRSAVEEKVSAELVVALKDRSGKAAGTVTFTVERETVLKNKKAEMAPPVDEQVKGKPVDGKPFEMGELLVTRIVCQDLVNVEGWGGKNDPFVTLRLGAVEKKTEHIPEGGANVCFDCLNFAFDVDKAALDFEPMSVTVTDRNTVNSDVVIGTASSSIKFTALRVGEELQLPLTLKNAKGADTGKAILFLTLKHAELKAAVELPLDPTFQSGLLLINRIRAFDLKKPKSMLGGTHVGNPYVKIAFGSWQYKTNPLNLASAGSPIFDNLDLSADVTAAMLETGKLSVEVYDKGMTGDTLVGKGECSMRSTAVEVGKEVQVEVDLVNAGATGGKLVFFAAAAQKKSKVRKEDVIVDETFQQGYCCIKAITAHSLANREMMGKQDPYVILEFAVSNWKERTVTMNEAGSDCHWKNLDLRCGGLTRDHLLAQDLVVTVMEDNVTGDVLIGKAVVFLLEAGAKGSLGKDIDICLDLTDDKGKPAGRLVLLCSLHPTAANLKIAPGLKEGVLKVKKIVAKGLETGNRISKNTPSIQFKYGTWEGTTGVGEGKEPVWEFLKLQSSPACSPEVLSTQSLIVSLLDNGKLIGSGTIDNLLLPGSQPDTDVDVPVALIHAKAGTPVGKLTITLNVGSPEVDLVALAAAEEEQAMPAYSEAVLLVTSIKAEGLANTEWVGKSDPFVVLTLGAWSDQTVPCENAGGEVIWNDLKFREEFTGDMLVHQPLDVAVYDKNNYSKNVLLGRGQASLKRVAYSMGKEVEILVQLQQGDKKGKSAGKVTLRAEIREQSKAFQKSLPADFVAGMLHVFRISAFNLPNRELMGKQDPFAVIKIGDFSDRTPTLSEAGSDPVFDLLDIKSKVTAAVLQNQPLEVELWEDNTTGNILLGTGKTTISKVTTVGEEVEFRVNLKDKKGESAGRALIFARLEEMPLTQEQEAVVPIAEGFTRGSICVRKICAFGLANTDLFPTKQDPYVMLQLGLWSDKTKVKDNAGTNSIWDLLSMEAEVDREALQSAQFEVKVMNSNSLRSHSEIGSGKVAVRRAAAKLKQVVELSVDLVNSKSGKPAGRVVLHVEVVPEELEESYTLPANFEFGHLQVARIEAFNLKNMELIGLQDPFVVLKYGEWTDKTYTQDDAGSDAVWNFLTIGVDVNRAAIQSQMLEVTVWDENKGRAHALVGTGTVSLLKCAAHLTEQVEMKVKLLDPKGALAGKVSLYGTLTIPEPDAELPDTFSEGALKIKRVSVFGLKNSELFGLKKGDPFLKIKINDFKAETKVLKSAGENPVWNNLDFLTNVDTKTIRAGEVIVEAWEKNSGAFGDKLLATCEIPLKRAGSKLGQEVELIAKMKTEKGEPRGEVNVLVQLDPIAALSLPDLGLPEKFSVGLVRIVKIQALGLDNKEFMRAKQDPYICVSIGDWSETTSTLTSAGSNATWTALDMVAEVNADILGKERMNVRVMDENTTRADSVLGVGTVSLRKLCPRINSTVELSVDLVAENGAAVGTVLVTAVLTESRLEDLADALPESAVVVKRGQLVVRKITALDLKGGDTTFFGGKQDPYVQLTLENEWSAKTEEKKNAGRSAVWTDISDIEMPVTMDLLKYKRITVTVLDKNLFKSDSWMGKGDFSLRKLGSNGGAPAVVTHTVRLKDKRGRSAGKVLVEAEIQPLPDTVSAAPGTSGSALQAPGMLSFLDCAVSKVTESALMGKQDLWVNLALATWKHTTEVHKSAGTESSWPLKTSSTPLAMAQLAAQGLQVEVCAHSMKGDTTLGRATLKLDKALAQPGKWVDLVTDLNGQTSGASSVGKFRVKARYTEGAAVGDLSFPPVADQGMDDLKNSQNALNNRVGTLEENIKAQLHKELLAERESILQAMAAQNKALSQSIEGLSRELAKERHAKASVLDGLVINQVNAIKLPSDVKQWRSAHVQAWISFQMELPQYAEPFQKASIDGLVLIKHVTRDTLQNSLDIVDPLHCQKILEGVQVLQNRQKEVDEAAEKERIKKLQKKKEEEDRKRAMMAELQKEAEAKKRREEKERDKDKKKKKKKSASGKVAPKTYFGEVREQNVVDRARIERDMRAYRGERQKQIDKADLASRTWKFEYTGAPQPKAETIWDSDPFGRKQGTSAYRKTMALDILGSQHFRASDDMPRAPSLTKMRNVPRNCAPEEVLALVKGAMYEVSNWLVEVEKIERRKSVVRDSDLGDANDDKVLSLLQQQEEEEFYYQQQRDYAEKWTEDDLDAEPNLPLANAETSFLQAGRVVAERSTDDVPPAYEDLVDMSDDGERDARSDEGEEELPPPAYDDFVEAEVPPPSYEEFFDARNDTYDEPVRTAGRSGATMEVTRSSPSPPRSKLFSLVHTSAGDLHAPDSEPDRMSLIYKALIGQQNNNARWLGTNEKLTRMKLYGGFESLLRLKIDWPQFDALWTQLDSKRSGDIDLLEFKAFFGDLDDFKGLMGTQTLATTSKSKSIAALSKCLFELCDALRHAGFTVVEMFSGFDRNGSGDVSISEFCSMLRLVVGTSVEKRLIYQALSVLDTNGDKAISLEEVLRFVYRVWKSQLDELAEKLSRWDDRMTGEQDKIRKAVEERRLIKEAIKKNFPREWRDRLEREGGHAIPGPFQALLQRMDVGEPNRTAFSGTKSGGDEYEDAPPTLFARSNFSPETPNFDAPKTAADGTTSSNLNLHSPLPATRSYRPSETWAHSAGAPSPSHHTGSNPSAHSALFTASAPLTARGSKSGRMPANATAASAGVNEIMRFKIKVPAGCAPTRTGAELKVPAVRDLNSGTVNSAEVTEAVLRKFAPFEGYG